MNQDCIKADLQAIKTLMENVMLFQVFDAKTDRQKKLNKAVSSFIKELYEYISACKKELENVEEKTGE